MASSYVISLFRRRFFEEFGLTETKCFILLDTILRCALGLYRIEIT